MKHIKFSIFLLLILIMSIGAVSANDDLNLTDVQVDYNSNILESSSHEFNINSDNYNSYFDSNGDIKSSSGISNGDSLYLSGTFNDKNFKIDKSVNIIGREGNLINNGIIYVSVNNVNVSSVNMVNVRDSNICIFLNNASYCNIFNNNIKSSGISSFPIALNPGSNYNNITNNILKTEGITLEGYSKSLTPMVLGGANYNYIANNYVETEDTNGIYLSKYGSGDFEGGESNYNSIFNNTVKCIVIPTSWAYGIQMMGNNNTAEHNKVIGYYRGISSAGIGNNVLNNLIINITGKDYQTGNINGGESAIVGGINSKIINNTIISSHIQSSAVISGANSIIENNNIDITGAGYGIQSNGNNITIKYNNISTVSGAGIYELGDYTGIFISNNNISSNSGLGILIKKQSNNKFPHDVNILYNYISTNNEYAINAAEADKDSYIINNNNINGSSKILTPNGTIYPSGYDYNFNGTVYNITEGNYSKFFDEKGNIINVDVKKGDIFNFIGEFDNKFMIISESLKLTSNNAIFYNSTIKVVSDAVWIEGIKIYNLNNNSIDKWGIYAKELSGITVKNCDIKVLDSAAAYAIYLVDCQYADILNNYLYSSGNYLTFTLLTYEVYYSNFINNTITTIGTGQLHGWEGDHNISGCLDGNIVAGEGCLDGSHIIPEIYRTYGILILYSSNNLISGNNVNVSSLVKEAGNSTNSLVGIDIYYDSHNNIVTKNNVSISGKDNYLYGLGVIGAPTMSGSITQFSNNNKFIANNLKINGSYFSTGIIAGYNSKDTAICENNLVISSNDVAYGVTLEGSQISNISKNNMNISSYNIYGIESFGSNDNNIIENNVSSEGNFVYGIAIAGSSNNNIIRNQIISVNNKNNQSSTLPHGDVIPKGNAGIFLYKTSTNNEIKDNYISNSAEYTILLDEKSKNNNITNNYLSAKERYGDNSVNNTLNNEVHDNYKFYFDEVSFPETIVNYNGITNLVIKSSVDGANVKFYVNGIYVGNVTVKDGIASLSYKTDLNVGNYKVQGVLSKKDYKSAEFNSTIEVKKASVIVQVQNTSAKQGSSVLISSKLVDEYGNPIKDIEVKFYRGNIYLGKNTTNEKGIASIVFTVPKSLSDGNYTLRALSSDSTNYLNGSGEGNINVGGLMKVILSDNNLVMYCHNGSKYIVTLTDELGNPLTNKDVIITLSGYDYHRTTDSDGKVYLNINLSPGDYKTLVKFEGDSDYSIASLNSSFKVLTTVTGDNLVKIYKNDSQYKAKFLDNQGNPLKNTKVKFNIDGVFYERTTDANGVATMIINLRPNNFIITAIHPNGQLFSNNITVLSSVKGNDLVKYFRNDSQYKVSFVDGQNNPLKNTEIQINIDGVFYKRTTDENGTATMVINLRPGTFILTAQNPVTGQYYSNTVTVLPVLYGSDVDMTFKDGSSYDVKLVDSSGNPIANANITLNIDGIFYYRVTDNNGIAHLTINLRSGKFIITAIYGYATTSNTITVHPQSTKLNSLNSKFIGNDNELKTLSSYEINVPKEFRSEDIRKIA